MLKKIFSTSTALILGFLSNVALADEFKDKQAIMKMMNQYVNAVACATSRVELKDIVNIYPPEEDYTGSTYYVLWSGDKGCEGGSGTMSAYISEVSRYSAGRPFLVNNDDALGDNNQQAWDTRSSFTNYRFINSIQKTKDNLLEVIGWDYADYLYGGKDGGNNFPANKFKYTLALNQDNQWKVIHQVLLEQNK